ncbi:AAA family ATPase [Nonomuraea sp. NPDC049400]|uniref:AAA family ATPase n=1 Tax=Nonomuraea sp. NPDC049400 TaxID=3364352 RepID=UPI0037BE00D3
MIIWINGAFGAGKTTLSGKLRERLPDSLVLDPEEIGFLLRATVPAPESGDFQDLPIWRRLTLTTLLELRRQYERPIIVPMTLVNPLYLEQIQGGAVEAGEVLLNLYLDLDKEVLRTRIKQQVLAPDPTRDEEIREWRLAQVDRCLAARALMPVGTYFVDSGALTPDELADRVLAEIDKAHRSG